MNLALDYSTNKGFRLLSIYERLNRGEVIKKYELSNCYNVSVKTIQRDINDLRAYLADEHQFESEIVIKYDRLKQGYYLVRFEREWLTNEDVLALSKIMLESRAFEKSELKQLLKKLLLQVTPCDRKIVEDIIKSEQLYYIPLKHSKKLLSLLWSLSKNIHIHETIWFEYTRKDGVVKFHEVNPVAIMFSEFYFYLIAFMADNSKDYPTVFRIDRIAKAKATGARFSIPYNKTFSDGEFRKRVQFMYSGSLRKVQFEYSGPSIESILDKLPTAQVKSELNGIYTLEAEVYGTGIDMWLRSQGNWIKIID